MPVDKLFGALNISASGLSAQRKKLDAIASNIANVNTTRTEDGTPYRRKITVMKANSSNKFETVLQEKSRKLATSNPNHLQRRNLAFTSKGKDAVVSASIEQDQSDFKMIYDPEHPDSDSDGYVKLPNINMVSEMVDMISASRSYEANLTAIDAAKKMAKAALEI